MDAPASGNDRSAARTGEDRGSFGPVEIAQALEAYYPRLKGLVRAQMSRLTGRRVDQLTESPTVHTNDLCMDLLAQRHRFRDAEHMMAVASIRCTQLLVDYLRRRTRRKRGGGRRGTSLPEDLVDGRSEVAPWLLAEGVDQALIRYGEDFPRQAQSLMLRTFFGRSTVEVAEILGVSSATVERDMHAARAYFQAFMADEGGTGGDDVRADERISKRSVAAPSRTRSGMTGVDDGSSTPCLEPLVESDRGKPIRR